MIPRTTKAVTRGRFRRSFNIRFFVGRLLRAPVSVQTDSYPVRFWVAQNLYTIFGSSPQAGTGGLNQIPSDNLLDAVRFENTGRHPARIDIVPAGKTEQPREIPGHESRGGILRERFRNYRLIRDTSGSIQPAVVSRTSIGAHVGFFPVAISRRPEGVPVIDRILNGRISGIHAG